MASVSKTLQNYRIDGAALGALKMLLTQKVLDHLGTFGHLASGTYEEFAAVYGHSYDADNLWQALRQGAQPVSIGLTELDTGDLTLTNPEWTEEQMLGALDKPYDRATFRIEALTSGTNWISIRASTFGWATVDIYTRDALWGEAVSMDEVLEILEHCRISPEETIEQAPRLPFRVFIGHGNDQDWRILRDDLRDKHSFEIEAFEGRPRIGQTIKDVLLDMASYSTAAVVVLTRADRTDAGEFRGRQNVVHELGLFQGLLGWEKVIIVMEEGVALPTNLDGTQQVRYPSGYIQTAVGETVAALNALKEEHEQEGHHP